MFVKENPDRKKNHVKNAKKKKKMQEIANSLECIRDGAFHSIFKSWTLYLAETATTALKLY